MDRRAAGFSISTSRVLALTAVVAALAAPVTKEPPPDPVDFDRPWWERSSGRGHGGGKLRKGTRPKVKAWSLRP